MNWVKAIFRFRRQRSSCYTSIVAKDIQSMPRSEPSLGKRLHALKIRHIEWPKFYDRRMTMCLRDIFALFGSSCWMLLPLRGLTTTQDQISTPCSERFCRFKSNAIIPTGNYNPFSSQVGSGNIFLCENGGVRALQSLEDVTQKVVYRCHFDDELEVCKQEMRKARKSKVFESASFKSTPGVP